MKICANSPTYYKKENKEITYGLTPQSKEASKRTITATMQNIK
jgi:hypothetical protein